MSPQCQPGAFMVPNSCLAASGSAAYNAGSIEVYSAGLGHGTQFIVRLPLVPPKSAVKLHSRATPSHSAPDGPTRRVLIVDDNIDSSESLALLIQAWGHEVAVAHDGVSALALAAEFLPELALVDIGLPGMNGYELAPRLRQAHRDLYLVAMTGYGRDEDRKTAHAAGFDLHVVKPADVEELQDCLRTARREPAADR
jgi:CheY-like chemotaxis protein